MAQDQLREFFREKRQRSEPANIDWAGRRDDWTRAVNDLYGRIEGEYLSAAKPDVEITRRDKSVSEDLIGEYHIPELVLRVGDEQLVFSPRGINVFGAKGRIDVQGDRGDGTIVWQAGDRWSVVAARTPTLRLVDLNADTLAELLRGVMRP